MLAFVRCESSDNSQNRDPEIDEFGVMLGVIDDYYGTGCQVEVQKKTSTRSGFIDEVYEFAVNKPGKGDLRFIITIEEDPNDDTISVKQYDEFWNEIVAVIYTHGHLTNVVVSDNGQIETRGWLNNFWNCSKARYREIEKVIEEDDDMHLWCAIVDYIGACTISSLAITAIDCF